MTDYTSNYETSTYEVKEKTGPICRRTCVTPSSNFKCNCGARS